MEEWEMNFSLLEQYVRTMRKPEKKRYAIAYWRFLHGYSTEEPVYEGKSMMAAQAIRMEIHSWGELKRTEPTEAELRAALWGQA
jgi:hypothetical protein